MIGTVQELPSPFTPEIPDFSIVIQENEEAYGRFVAEPLDRGHALCQIPKQKFIVKPIHQVPNLPYLVNT